MDVSNNGPCPPLNHSMLWGLQSEHILACLGYGLMGQNVKMLPSEINVDNKFQTRHYLERIYLSKELSSIKH